MKKKMSKKQEDQVVTMGLLLEFTEDILIPRLSDVMDEKIKASEDRIDKKLKTMKADIEHTIKAYMDRKSTETIEEVFRRLEKKYGQEKAFREKVVEVLKKNKIGTKEDFAYFEGILAAA
jgi:hypothetical protein